MLNRIINGNNKILYSDINLIELKVLGYSIYELRNMFEELKPLLIFVESINSQIGKAKDISAKRHIPKGDVLHAILARDNRATLITFDNHFKKLGDIIKSYKPQEII